MTETYVTWTPLSLLLEKDLRFINNCPKSFLEGQNLSRKRGLNFRLWADLVFCRKALQVLFISLQNSHKINLRAHNSL